jgi:prevent-host-death family protein
MRRRAHVIPQRELRNHSGKILREAEAGRRFTITVDGRPVAELGPPSGRKWVLKAAYAELLARRPVDPALFEELAGFGGTLEELEGSR